MKLPVVGSRGPMGLLRALRDTWGYHRALERIAKEMHAKRLSDLDPHWINAICRTRIFGPQQVEGLWDELTAWCAMDSQQIPPGEKRKMIVAALDMGVPNGVAPGTCLYAIYGARVGYWESAIDALSGRVDSRATLHGWHP